MVLRHVAVVDGVEEPGLRLGLRWGCGLGMNAVGSADGAFALLASNFCWHGFVWLDYGCGFSDIVKSELPVGAEKKAPEDGGPT